MDDFLPKTIKELLPEDGLFNDLSKIISDLIESDLISDEKRKAKEGIEYYRGKHEIMSKQRYYYDKLKKRQVDTLKFNSRPVNNFHADFVDEKVFYVAGQRPTIASADENLVADLDDAIDLTFYQTIQDAIEGASNKGCDYLYVYADESRFKCVVMPFEELIVIRDRSFAGNITDVIRYYHIERIIDGEAHKLYRVEWYKPEGVTFFQQQLDGSYELDDTELVNPKPYLTRTNTVDSVTVPVETSSWNLKIPFIEVANNRRRQTDLERIKSLQDLYNSIESGLFDNIADIQEVILAVSGITGNDPAELQENLRYYKLAQFDDADGKITPVKVEIPVEAREVALKRLYRDIHHFGKAVLFEPDKYASAPSGVALKFLYSRLDMKADDVILSLETALTELVEFFKIFQQWANRKKYSDDSFVQWTFHKSQIFNEVEQVDSAQKSKGIVSNRTVLANHPFVTDVQDELEQIEKERGEAITLDEPTKEAVEE